MHFGILELITMLIMMAAIFLFVNTRFLKLPSTIGLMLLAVLLSLVVMALGLFIPSVKELARSIFTEYKFSDVLFNVMLSFMLFSGSLDINLNKLGEEKWMVFILAIFGTLISTFIVGFGVYFLLPIAGIQIDLIYCLLFGALISPTDPIAVLAMIKKTHVSKNLEIQIAGESLFNDGVGVVIFLSILSIAIGGVENFHVSQIAVIFFREVCGGILFGAVMGFIGLKILQAIDNKYVEIEVLVTLSLVMMGSLLAHRIHVSGPLAMVVMGIFLGKEGRSEKLAEATGEYVYKFWGLVDEALNAILFVLIGLQILMITWHLDFILSVVIAIIVVLAARWVGVALPVSLMRIKRRYPPYTIRILTWSGLRGGISVALALSLYEQIGTMVDKVAIDVMIAMTYSVVLFSIIVQGLTIDKLFARFKG